MLIKDPGKKLDIVFYACLLSSGEAEAGGSLGLDRGCRRDGSVAKSISGALPEDSGCIPTSHMVTHNLL